MTESEVRLDLTRHDRNGLEEAIFCERKSDAQIKSILDHIYTRKRSCLLTRLNPDQYCAIASTYRSMFDYDETSQTAFFNWCAEQDGKPEVAVITAGSSDVPVAREAIRTLEYFHIKALAIFDVGVAGLWRLTERIEDIRQMPIAIVAAGMDAALPSVLGGLYPGLIVAIPTSVGYGVASGGTTALNAILASCSPGIVTVNIDNGYGAANAALRAVRLIKKGVDSDRSLDAQEETETAIACFSLEGYTPLSF